MFFRDPLRRLLNLTQTKSKTLVASKWPRFFLAISVRTHTIRTIWEVPFTQCHLICGNIYHSNDNPIQYGLTGKLFFANSMQQLKFNSLLTLPKLRATCKYFNGLRTLLSLRTSNSLFIAILWCDFLQYGCESFPRLNTATRYLLI